MVVHNKIDTMLELNEHNTNVQRKFKINLLQTD